MMSLFNMLAYSMAVLTFIWAVWFLLRLIQYIASGEYEMDQRLREICK